MASMGASLNTDALAYYNGLLVAFDYSSFHTATFIDPLTDTIVDVLSLGIANLGGVAGAASRGSFFASGVDGGAVIFEIDAVTGAVVNSFASPVAAPHGIAFVDGGTVHRRHFGHFERGEPR